jgi:putative oxidoreductase
MKKKFILIVSILFGLMFINAGLSKFFNYIPLPEDIPRNLTRLMNSILKIDWLWQLFGTLEILGGILFMINKFRALGAIIIFPIMIGILITHIFFVDYNTLPIAIALMFINLWVIWENREKYLPMIR